MKLYKNTFKPNISIHNLIIIYKNKNNLKKIKILYCLSGRIILIRKMGKSSFLNISYDGFYIQIFIKKNNIKNTQYNLLKSLDLGNIISIIGFIMKTKTNELTINVYSFSILLKNLKMLPEKWHGLKNIEKKYRERYIDLLSNNDSRNVFIKRFKIINKIREFFNKNNFIETETPILTNFKEGADALPFEAYYQFFKKFFFLRIATELYLKQLIVGGFEKVYEIGKIFRNEGVSTKHNPEFTSIEFYQSYATYKNFIKLTEILISKINLYLHKKNKIIYQNNIINFSTPFKKTSITKLISQYFNMNKKESKIITKIQKIKKAFDLYNKCMKNQNDPLLICINELSKNEIKNIFPFINTKHKKNNILKQIKDQIKSSKKNINNHIILIIDNFLKKHITRRRQVALQILYLIFQNKVEQTLIQPTFVTGFSNLSNPLAKKNNNDRALIDRFELFCSGIEIANSFSELNNPIEQKKRFLKQINDNKNEISINKNYINALKIGMPPTAGEGIGIDRLIMILTNSKSIKDVILFPTMK